MCPQVLTKIAGGNFDLALSPGGNLPVYIGTDTVSALPAVLAILENNVQLLGPVSAPATTIFFDSNPFTLQPDIPGGSPTVRVTGQMSVADSFAGENIAYQLVRDRVGVLPLVPVVLMQQSATNESGVDGPHSSVTLEFLDTVGTVDVITGAPEPLTSGSIHTYSIRAIATGTLEAISGGFVPASIILEQQLGGSSSTVGNTQGGINLGTAAQYAGFAGAGISNVAPSVITGDLGVDPIASTAITGFALTLDGSGQFSTSAQVAGKVYAPDYAVPTPAKVVLAASDMLTAYTAAQARTPGTTNLAAGHLGGQTITPGVYKWTTPVECGSAPAGDLTLNGAGIYILQMTGTFDLFTRIVLTGGALPQNVFFAVAGAVTLHPASVFNGELLAATSIATQAGAKVTGRLLSQTGITLISTTLTQQ